MVILVVFVLSLILTKLYINYALKKNIGQLIKKDGPDLHGYKEGTPTIGGVVFITVSLIFMLLLKTPIFVALSTLFFSIIGFLDDIIGVLRRDAYSIKARTKFFLQVLVSAALVFIFLSGRSSVNVFDNYELEIGRTAYLVFAIFVIVGTSNAINLTDGLDGLAGSTFVVAGLSSYFYLLLNKNTDEKSLLIVIASVLGFLIFNTKPAKVFMGDTGSLGLGAYLGSLAIFYRFELLLLFFGVIFVVETISVIIQVASFKLFKRRIFKMAPLHHHFELSGWEENKIVSVFVVVNVVTSLMAVEVIGK